MGSMIVRGAFIKIVINELKIREFKLDSFTLILSVIVLLIIIGSMHYVIIPSIKDLPYVIKKDFKTVTGESLDSSIARSNMSAHILKMKDDKTGEVISIELYYQPGINKGDRLTVNYLPNTRIGNVKGKGYYGKDKY